MMPAGRRRRNFSTGSVPLTPLGGRTFGNDRAGPTIMIRASTFGTGADFFYSRGLLTVGPELDQLLLDGFPLL